MAWKKKITNCRTCLNYIKILNSNKFWSSLNNSLLWVVGNAIAQTVFAFLIALTLNKKFTFQKSQILPWLEKVTE